MLDGIASSLQQGQSVAHPGTLATLLARGRPFAENLRRAYESHAASAATGGQTNVRYFIDKHNHNFLSDIARTVAVKATLLTFSARSQVPVAHGLPLPWTRARYPLRP